MAAQPTQVQATQVQATQVQPTQVQAARPAPAPAGAQATKQAANGKEDDEDWWTE